MAHVRHAADLLNFGTWESVPWHNLQTGLWEKIYYKLDQKERKKLAGTGFSGLPSTDPVKAAYALRSGWIDDNEVIMNDHKIVRSACKISWKYLGYASEKLLMDKNLTTDLIGKSKHAWKAYARIVDVDVHDLYNSIARNEEKTNAQKLNEITQLMRKKLHVAHILEEGKVIISYSAKHHQKIESFTDEDGEHTIQTITTENIGGLYDYYWKAEYRRRKIVAAISTNIFEKLYKEKDIDGIMKILKYDLEVPLEQLPIKKWSDFTSENAFQISKDWQENAKKEGYFLE